MSWVQTLVRAAVSAVVGTGLAVVVNLATSGDYSGWVWGGVGVLTLAVFGVSLWQQQSVSSSASSAQPLPAVGIDLSDVETTRGMSADGVDATGTAVKVEKGRFGGSLDFKNIRAGRGDVSGP
ncbi:hypothetical protein ACTD5D_20890 [Nocardia takedensis]|uniref:hypothetical protein n=1 Tax=Nocardia takedensis TaxID=259390 RepID=UPI003F774DB6